MRRPYTQRRRAEETAKTRARILAAARKRLPDADQLQVHDIAALAGVSVQTLYSHFGSKAGLLSAVITDVSQETGLFRGIERVWQAKDGETALRTMIRVTFRFWHESWDFIDFCLRVRRSDPELGGHVRRLDESRLHHFGVISSRLEEEGRLQPRVTPATAARLALAVTTPYVYEELVRQGDMSVVAAGRMATEAVVQTVLRPGTKPVKSTTIDWSKFGLKPPVT